MMAPSDSVARPHILVILTDQFRWDCLRAAGNVDIHTPNLDQLVADGVRYANAFCPFPVCTPSRYSILSGLYVRQHAGWTNRTTLPPGIPTFPRVLRRAGYRTACVGKMHCTPTYLDVGFDRMELAEQDGDGRLDDDYHRDLVAHGLVDALDLIDQRREFRVRAPQRYWDTLGADTSDLPEAWHSTTWIGDRAVRQLEQWTADQPSLLLASFIKPHHPFDPPFPWDRMYDPASLSLLPGWIEALPDHDGALASGYFPNRDLTEGALRRVMAHYYATISQIDHHIGRMVDLLRARGLYERAVIVFTADHGEYLGFHHMLLKGGHMYDPLVRVPLIVKWPTTALTGSGMAPRGVAAGGRAAPGGGITAGAAPDTLVSTVDLAPTILRQAGVAPPAQMGGLNLADPAARRDVVFTESRRGQMVMARSQTHKLLYTAGGVSTTGGTNVAGGAGNAGAGQPSGPDRSNRPGESFAAGEHLFFDLVSDPLELTNRYHDPEAQAAVSQLRDALASWAIAEAVPPPYEDNTVSTIQQPNVPDGHDQHRAELLATLERGVAAYLRAQA